MKRIALLILVNVLIVSASAQKSKKVKTAEDSLAYAIGVSMYEGVKGLSVDMELKMLHYGMLDAEKEESMFSAEDANLYIQGVLQELEAKKAEANKEEGRIFLEENKLNDNVVETESGLQYKIIEQGDGPVPIGTDKVKVHYSGFLLDGTKFDSSVDRGEPAVFGVGQVIKGWTEVLQLMPVGSTYKVFIPSDLAYGDRGAGADIKPGSVLVFDIELIEIQ